MNSTSTTPQALIAAANELVPLIGVLNAKGNDASLALASELQHGIDRALDTATDLNADAVIELLKKDAHALARLKTLTGQAQSAAHAIAKDEARAESAIAFCASAVSFGVGVTTGNLGKAGSAVADMLQALKIG